MSGTVEGHDYQIWAWQSGDDELCLELRVSSGQDPQTGGCGFDDSPSGGRTLSWDLDDGKSLVFGPVPERSASVRITGSGFSEEVVEPQSLPQSSGSARLFTAMIPKGGTVLSIVPLDSDEKALEPQDF